MTVQIGSLFSGAGGLDMAVETVFGGGDTMWHCELDRAASKVLEHRYPNTPNLGDVTQVNWTDLEPIDVLCGGYPCQPFSLGASSRRKGTNDERHLWPYFAEAIRVLRPRHVVLENVAGHRSMGFDSVLADLAALRYVGSWRSLRASDVGAPHRRERLFVLATDTTQPGRQRLSAGTGSGHREQRQDSVTGRPGHPALDLLPTPNASDASGGGQHPDKREGHSRQLIDYVLTTNWGRYEPAIRRWEQRTRPAPVPTEPTKNGNPRLSARFSEWMMGWPDGWVTDVPGLSRSDALKIIGNGVVPQCAAAALHSLLALSNSGRIVA